MFRRESLELKEWALLEGKVREGDNMAHYQVLHMSIQQHSYLCTLSTAFTMYSPHPNPPDVKVRG